MQHFSELDPLFRYYRVSHLLAYHIRPYSLADSSPLQAAYKKAIKKAYSSADEKTVTPSHQKAVNGTTNDPCSNPLLIMRNFCW
mmetsp:Transcript_16567/g.29197  ORF Transcript_16567/g.29197 Transcript_16567/m.29197 type:complete len:84 (+) Transcript_16567:357-608(+)